MKAESIRKYMSRSLPSLLKRAEHYCHKYIRERDKDQPCISCNQYRTLEAGHYYPAGKYSMLKFNEFNINGECKQCNYFSGDHLVTYRENLIRKWGQEKVDELDLIAGYNKRTSNKWSKIEIAEKIEYYKTKLKEL